MAGERIMTDDDGEPASSGGDHREGSDGPRRRPAGRSRSPRLIDIARAVGVHTSTVSRVLNGDPAQSVRPEVYDRIVLTARQQGYRPNALARGLKRRRTGAIAMVVPMLRNPIWVRLQRGSLQRALACGYVVMIMEEPTDEPKPPDSYRYLVEESRADGLLIATALRVREHADGVSGVPHVYVNRQGPVRGDNVVMDEARAVRLFIEHIVGLGHRNLALIDGAHNVDTIHRRVSAARRICARAGLNLRVIHAEPTEGGGYDAAMELLRGSPRPTACGIGSINQVFGAMGALRAAKVAVPASMSVVSFDEDDCLEFLDVPVTSVEMPLAELGMAAVDALITRIDGEPGEDMVVRAPMRLVTRQSVGPAAG